MSNAILAALRDPEMADPVLSLDSEVRQLRDALAAVIRSGDRAARGAQVMAAQGQAVVVVGGEQWQEMRRAMIRAGRAMVGERGQVN